MLSVKNSFYFWTFRYPKAHLLYLFKSFFLYFDTIFFLTAQSLFNTQLGNLNYSFSKTSELNFSLWEKTTTKVHNFKIPFAHVLRFLLLFDAASYIFIPIKRNPYIFLINRTLPTSGYHAPFPKKNFSPVLLISSIIRFLSQRPIRFQMITLPLPI